MGLIRFLLLLVVVAGAFVGGFYSGLWYRDEQIRERPEEVLKIYGDELQKKAGKKIDRLKEVLLEE